MAHGSNKNKRVLGKRINEKLPKGIQSPRIQGKIREVMASGRRMPYQTFVRKYSAAIDFIQDQEKIELDNMIREIELLKSAGMSL